MTGDPVIVCIDARRCAAGVLRDLASLVADYPGQREAHVLIETSRTRPRHLRFRDPVDACPSFVAEAEALTAGWVVTQSVDADQDLDGNQGMAAP